MLYDYPAGFQEVIFDVPIHAIKIAAVKHAKPGQIALAWPLHKRGNIVPIPGTKCRKYLDENVGAETVRLELAQMKMLDDALAPVKVSGQPE